MIGKMIFTLEDYKRMKIISNTEGRPSSTLTDEKWQREFRIRKKFIIPTQRKKLKTNAVREDAKEEYYGETVNTRYAMFINDMLKNLRSGNVDYCYFMYQVLDLVRFFPNTLKTRYVDGYWEVWLDA